MASVWIRSGSDEPLHPCPKPVSGVDFSRANGPSDTGYRPLRSFYEAIASSNHPACLGRFHRQTDDRPSDGCPAGRALADDLVGSIDKVHRLVAVSNLAATSAIPAISATSATSAASATSADSAIPTTSAIAEEAGSAEDSHNARSMTERPNRPASKLVGGTGGARGCVNTNGRGEIKEVIGGRRAAEEAYRSGRCEATNNEIEKNGNGGKARKRCAEKDHDGKEDEGEDDGLGVTDEGGQGEGVEEGEEEEEDFLRGARSAHLLKSLITADLFQTSGTSAETSMSHRPSQLNAFTSSGTDTQHWTGELGDDYPLAYHVPLNERHYLSDRDSVGHRQPWLSHRGACDRTAFAEEEQMKVGDIERESEGADGAQAQIACGDGGENADGFCQECYELRMRQEEHRLHHRQIVRSRRAASQSCAQTAHPYISNPQMLRTHQSHTLSSHMTQPHMLGTHISQSYTAQPFMSHTRDFATLAQNGALHCRPDPPDIHAHPLSAHTILAQALSVQAGAPTPPGLSHGSAHLPYIHRSIHSENPTNWHAPNPTRALPVVAAIPTEAQWGEKLASAGARTCDGLPDNLSSKEAYYRKTAQAQLARTTAFSTTGLTRSTRSTGSTGIAESPGISGIPVGEREELSSRRILDHYRTMSAIDRSCPCLSCALQGTSQTLPNCRELPQTIYSQNMASHTVPHSLSDKCNLRHNDKHTDGQVEASTQRPEITQRLQRLAERPLYHSGSGHYQAFSVGHPKIEREPEPEPESGTQPELAPELEASARYPHHSRALSSIPTYQHFHPSAPVPAALGLSHGSFHSICHGLSGSMMELDGCGRRQSRHDRCVEKQREVCLPRANRQKTAVEHLSLDPGEQSPKQPSPPLPTPTPTSALALAPAPKPQALSFASASASVPASALGVEPASTLVAAAAAAVTLPTTKETDIEEKARDKIKILQRLRPKSLSLIAPTTQDSTVLKTPATPVTPASALTPRQDDRQPAAPFIPAPAPKVAPAVGPKVVPSPPLPLSPPSLIERAAFDAPRSGPVEKTVPSETAKEDTNGVEGPEVKASMDMFVQGSEDGLAEMSVDRLIEILFADSPSIPEANPQALVQHPLDSERDQNTMQASVQEPVQAPVQALVQAPAQATTSRNKNRVDLTELKKAVLDCYLRFLIALPSRLLEDPIHLLFQLEDAYWWYLDFWRDLVPEKLPYLSFNVFAQLLLELFPALGSNVPSATRMALLKDWLNYKRTVPTCGAIIFNHSLTKMLMVQAWRSARWHFPRGKMDENETDEECAIREVFEETGIRIHGKVHTDVCA